MAIMVLIYLKLEILPSICQIKEFIKVLRKVLEKPLFL